MTTTDSKPWLHRGPHAAVIADLTAKGRGVLVVDAVGAGGREVLAAAALNIASRENRRITVVDAASMRHFWERLLPEAEFLTAEWLARNSHPDDITYRVVILANYERWNRGTKAFAALEHIVRTEKNVLGYWHFGMVGNTSEALQDRVLRFGGIAEPDEWTWLRIADVLKTAEENR